MKDYNKNVSTIIFKIKRAKNGAYDVFMQSDKNEVLAGQFPTRELAEDAAKKCQAQFDANCVGKKKVYVHERHSVSVPTVSQMQVVAMGLDPMRAARFREQIVTINFLVHMLTDAFDSMEGLFNKMVDQSTKTHYKIACKHIDAMLDSIYQSNVMGATDDDYTAVASAAYAMKERLELICTYVWRSDWRFQKWDECLSNLIDERWLEDERQKVGAEIRELITNNAHQEQAEIKPIKKKNL